MSDLETRLGRIEGKIDKLIEFKGRVTGIMIATSSFISFVIDSLWHVLKGS